MYKGKKLTVKITDDGKGCTKCKKFLPFEDFHTIKARTPYASRCKKCVNKIAKKRRAEVFG